MGTRGLCGARKFLPSKIGEKLSVQLFCDVCIHLIEIIILWNEEFQITVSVESEKGHLEMLFII